MSDVSALERVGTVVGLWRYPVKSMAAEALKRADVGWQGLDGDRRWAFVRDDVRGSGFPWLTIRQNPGMQQYRPAFVDETAAESSAVEVRTPAGVRLGVDEPKLAAELWPKGASAIKQNRGAFDTFPLSLITVQTVRQLGELVGEPLEVARFRPNILVDTGTDEPFPEDAWVGRTLRIGSARLRVDKRDGRCVVITVDPETSERNPAVLRAVAQEREGCLGVYGSTVEPGGLSLGDPVVSEP
ncbi:hypothetical protein ABI59_07610 [Acidobacteria bacterium Mor1]|nr:hypothetical protein ABI59_07610 [Acidobacteria bacterium Mor1]